jgi:hypothetical protein
MSMGDSHSRSERETEWGNRKSPGDRVRLNWNASHAETCMCRRGCDRYLDVSEMMHMDERGAVYS